MSLYINSAVATEHRAQLVREASAWRLRHLAKRAGAARRAAGRPSAEETETAIVYCRRAACAGCTA